MMSIQADHWKPAELNSLLADVIDAVESGEIDSAFDNVKITVGNLSSSKNARNLTKNYLMACLQAGLKGISEAGEETALGLVNAYRMMNAEVPLDELPEAFKVFAIKLPSGDGKLNVEIYIKEGDKVLYGEKVMPRGILTENFLILTGSTLL